MMDAQLFQRRSRTPPGRSGEDPLYFRSHASENASSATTSSPNAFHCSTVSPATMPSAPWSVGDPASSSFGYEGQVAAFMEAQYPGTSTQCIIREILAFTPQILKAYLREDTVLVRQLGRVVGLHSVWLAAWLSWEQGLSGASEADRFATRSEVVWAQGPVLETPDVESIVRSEQGARWEELNASTAVSVLRVRLDEYGATDGVLVGKTDRLRGAFESLALGPELEFEWRQPGRLELDFVVE
ncbi:hypothetical protein P7C70_g9165, partial [Phenoliferia sp. Uapishka_3]